MLSPDLILHSGKVITLDRGSRTAQALAVQAGLISAVGQDGDILKHAGPSTQMIDLKGATLLPGFFDAHPHADREGLKARGGIPIAGLRSISDIVAVRAVWGWWSRRPFPSVANTLALKRAGVDRDTTAPPNVEILKDVDGEP